MIRIHIELQSKDDKYKSFFCVVDGAGGFGRLGGVSNSSYSRQKVSASIVTFSIDCTSWTEGVQKERTQEE